MFAYFGGVGLAGLVKPVQIGQVSYRALAGLI